MTNATASVANLINIATVTAIGTDRKYILPNLDGGKAEGLLKDTFGEMEGIIESELEKSMKEEPNTLFANPFTLPEVGSEIENQLVAFTERVMDLAINMGFIPSVIEGDATAKWNGAVEELAQYIATNDVATPVELEVTPLTAEQSAEIVSEVETTPEGATALEEAQQIVSEELGIEVSAEAALQILSGEKILKAQNTSIALSGAAKNKLAAVLGDLQEVLEMVGASEHIQVALRDATQAAIPATVETVEVTA